MIALLAAACLAAQDPPQEEGFDPLDWVRRLDKLDLSWSLGEFEVEAGGELVLELFFFGDEAPGVSVEQAALRAEKPDNFPTETVYKRGAELDSPEGGGRLLLVVDGFVGDWLAYSVEARADHGAPFVEDHAVNARLEQYWARFMIPDEPAVNLQLGKFPAPIGNFIPRHYPKANPLTTFPLPYDHVTTFMYKLDPPDVVLGRRDLPDVKDWRVPIWQAVYGTGAMAFGKAGAFEYAVAVMNSAPGSWPWDWDLHEGDFRYPNVYLRGSYALDIGTKVGASGSKGPYDRKDAMGIPPGRNTGDFPQTLAGVDFEHSQGDFDFFAELIWTRFEAPLVDDLELWSYYVEAKYTLLPGLFGAARFAQMFFGEIRDSTGADRQWDRNHTRIELGGGYFFTQNLFLKATVQSNHTHGGREPDDHMLMMQLGLTF